jgi:hypothetical protein
MIDMPIDDRINAVLTEWQLERFCRVFDVAPADLEVDFSGWHKITLVSRDAVFLFPRTPPNARSLGRELSLYEWLGPRVPVMVPRLIRRVRDRRISYYEIGAVTRLPGAPFARYMPRLGPERRDDFLMRLTDAVSAWQGTSLSGVPAGLLPGSPRGSRPGARALSGRITAANWHRMVLAPGSSRDAVDFICRFVRRLSAGRTLPGALARETETLERWTDACAELAELPHVLVHGDVHEGHLLMDPDSMRITGILDWETARIDNPVWDFNFGEWGAEICQWWDELPALRRRMWPRYLQNRGLAIRRVEGLNLFFTLWDLLWMVYARRKDGHIVTGTDYGTAVEIYLERLAAVTDAL